MRLFWWFSNTVFRLDLGPTFKDDLAMMYAVFNSLHPKNGLSKEIGVLERTVNALKNLFPQHHHEVLKVAASEFTFRRLKMLNQKVQEKKEKKGTGGDMSLRSKTATARFMHWFFPSFNPPSLFFVFCFLFSVLCFFFVFVMYFFYLFHRYYVLLMNFKSLICNKLPILLKNLILNSVLYTSWKLLKSLI